MAAEFPKKHQRTRAPKVTKTTERRKNIPGMPARTIPKTHNYSNRKYWYSSLFSYLCERDTEAHSLASPPRI